MTTIDVRMVKNRIHELASQIYVLGTGLQNAAPPGSPGKSVMYLLETSAQLEQTSINIEVLLPNNSSEAK